MTDLAEIDRFYHQWHGYVSDETRETCRRFEALLEQGLEPGPDTDWLVYGYWAQLKLGLGEKDGHDHDERVLRLVRSLAERDIDWTPGDAHASCAAGLMGWSVGTTTPATKRSSCCRSRRRAAVASGSAARSSDGWESRAGIPSHV